MLRLAIVMMPVNTMKCEVRPGDRGTNGTPCVPNMKFASFVGDREKMQILDPRHVGGFFF